MSRAELETEPAAGGGDRAAGDGSSAGGDGTAPPPRARRRSMLDKVLGRNKRAENDGGEGEGEADGEGAVAVDDVVQGVRAAVVGNGVLFTPNLSAAPAGVGSAASKKSAAVTEREAKSKTKPARKANAKTRRRRPSTLPISQCAAEDLLITLEARKVNPKRVKISAATAAALAEVRAHFGDDLDEGIAVTCVLETGDDTLEATKTLERCGFVSRRVQMLRKQRGGRRRKSTIQLPGGVKEESYAAAAAASAVAGAAAAGAAADGGATSSGGASADRAKRRRRSSGIQMSAIATDESGGGGGGSDGAADAKAKQRKGRRRSSAIQFEAIGR